ncbi:MAG: OmpA family protein [Spongiibacteraceae bacterium]
MIPESKADVYVAAFDQASWQVQHSPLTCKLSQVVPRFGEATFETVGGGRQRFWLRAKNNPWAGGPSELKAVAPNWNPKRAPIAIGSIDIVDGSEPLQLSEEPAKKLLDSLNAGLVPTFVRPLSSDSSKSVSVKLSPINFRAAYRQYGECIGQLLPFTFDDIKNTTIEFPLEQSELSAGAQKKIDTLLRYIALDHSITHFEIRGVSSDKQRRLDNLQLAKQRVQQVSEYLMSRGIDAKAIESTYRGERPAKGAQRLVTIRLKRSSDASES